jgi:glycosyltransferase involved in cell wall biosynthesis
MGSSIPYRLLQAERKANCRVTRRIFYLTPYPPARSGIADYAARFRDAIESQSEWRLDVGSLDEIVGNSPFDLSRIKSRLKRWRSERNFDGASLVHAEIGYRQHAALYALLLLRSFEPRLPYCITAHDPPLIIAPALYPMAFGSKSVLVRHGLRVLDYTPLARTLIARALAGASRIFALSHGGVDALRRRFPRSGRVEYLPHVDYRHDQSRDLRSKPPGTSPVVLYLGFWGPGKGLGTLLRAAELLAPGDGLTFRVRLGGGPDESRGGRMFAEDFLREVAGSPARSRIEVLGHVPDSDLDRTFEEADLFVLPYSEAPGASSSAALFRAAGAGLPVVATKTGTFAEHVVDGKTGLLVPPDDPPALAAAIGRLLREPQLARRLGEAAREHVRQRHGDRTIAAQVTQAYEDAAGANGAS